MRLLHIHDLEFQPISMLRGACIGVLIEVHVEVCRGHKGHMGVCSAAHRGTCMGCM